MANTHRPRLSFLPAQEEQNQLKIKRVTQSFEVCEVNGFVFKRRRQTIVPENAHPNQTHPVLQHQFQTPAGHHQMMMMHNYNHQHPGYHPQQHPRYNQNAPAPSAVSLNFDEYAISRELYQRLSLRLGALPEEATPAERLGAYVDAVCDAEQLSVSAAAAAANNNNDEEEEKLSETEAVRDVLTMFRKSVVTALKMGTITCLDGPPSTPATGRKNGNGNYNNGEYDNDDFAQLEARKAGLRARLARFEEEEQEWQNLLSKVEEMQGELEAQAAAAAAALVQTQDDDDNNNNNDNDIGEALELRQLQANVHRELALQVEGLCMLVGDVEELADVADQSAHAMQAQYHAEKFKTFPHMDSPDRLIRDILRPTTTTTTTTTAVGEEMEKKEKEIDGVTVKEEEAKGMQA